MTHSKQTDTAVYYHAMTLLEYRPHGRFLHKIDRSGGAVKGSPAGCKKAGRQMIYGVPYGGKMHYLLGGKLAWFANYGFVPDDHPKRRDGDIHNDRIKNLYL